MNVQWDVDRLVNDVFKRLVEGFQTRDKMEASMIVLDCVRFEILYKHTSGD